MAELIKSVIGIRKMAVIMFCVAGIVAIIVARLHYNQPTPKEILGLAILSIAGLGGYHLRQQGQIDKDKSNGV